MRDDVLMQLTDKVLKDEGFRSRLRTDLDGALRDEGFALNDDELTAVRSFHGTAAGMSDSELQAALTDPTRRQFAA